LNSYSKEYWIFYWDCP